MLRGEFHAAGEFTPEELLEAYQRRLVTTIESVGLSTVAEETGLGRGTLLALQEGESPELSLEEAAAILGTDPGLPDADTIVAEAQDILLMGMSSAVLDVEAVASGIDDEMDPKEIQQKVEGRHPMPLADYALLHSYIEREKR